ncbi:MAG: SDR family oxidoreductase, partial [Chloroflexi bacterium]|nr:SDR family oxidoreductase [Chloroflexota bacterium]
MPGRLDGKIAIVTGGNSGIGKATAQLFAREGAKVALLARREPEGVSVQDAIRSEGGEATYIQCDVTDRDAVDSAVGKVVETYGGVDVLFNNAGHGARGNFPDEDDDGWDSVIQVNLNGTFYMSRAAWPHLIKSGSGAIVNMSSIAAVIGFSKNMYDLSGRGVPSSSYYVAKAGIDAFTRYCAGRGGEH